MLHCFHGISLLTYVCLSFGWARVVSPCFHDISLPTFYVFLYVCRAVLGPPLVLNAFYTLRFADAIAALVSCLHVSVCVAALLLES